ncbi:RHS repeat domain-containing protein [Chryseobacterium chendengshani]|uniref:hypothetical protein n=1 Tax=Chryseobacterium sp. LJ756 TaxID=2864113 RepID=UPI001C63F609|nr:hypothetical protein [Chryseobacterium sp. LJ756]MBW7674752.1 hypothetical protein [Chryseobacterium sp. LJ756]
MRKNLILIYTIFITGCLAAQSGNGENESIPKIIPPSPTVNSLMKFEEVPVSNYTGIPDITIPIANLPTGLSNVPINLSLKYHVNNAKSESKASEVGLGWSLMAGGTISRTVMGSPDDKIVSYSIGSSNPKIGIYLDQNTNVNTYKNYFASYIENPNTAINTQKSIFEAHYKNRYDTQYDLYQYNFLNYTGRFIIKKIGGQLQVVKLDKNNLKITVNAPSNFEPVSFDITDEFGNKFTFDVLETSKTLSLTDVSGLEMYSSTSASTMNLSFNSAFHLSKIQNNNNEVKVLLSYEQPVTIQSSEQVSNQNHINYIPGSYTSNVMSENKALLPKISEVSTSTIITQTRKLKEIDLIGKGKIVFEYENGREDTNYVGGYNATMLSKLKSITVLGSDNKYDEKYNLNFDYKQNGPYKRLFLTSVQKMNKNNGSYALDHDYQLDYYVPQLSLPLIAGDDIFFKCFGDMPYGCSHIELLKSVTYPTKGKSEFIYETGTFSYVPETTTGISVAAVELSNYDENPLNWDPANQMAVFNKFSSDKKYAFTLPENNTSISMQLGTYNINQYAWNLRLFRKEGTTYTNVGSIGTAFLNPGDPAPTVYNNILQAGEYYLELTSTQMGTGSLTFNANFHTYYKIRNANNYKFLHDYRANRIKNINYYSDYGNTPHKTVNFDYQNISDPKKSTGALVFPRPVYSYSVGYQAGLEFTCGELPNRPCMGTFITDISYGSTRNFLPVQKTKGGDIGYQYITVSETGRGKTLYQYTSPVDKPNSYTVSTLPPFRGVANYDYTRGILLNKKVYDNSNRLLAEDQFVYTYSSYDVATGAFIDPLPTANIGYYLHGGKYNNYEEFVADTFGLKPHVGNDPFAFLALGFQTEHIGVANLVEEKSISYYPNQHSATITTNNEYNLRDYLTKKIATSTDNSIVETTYQYAHEKNNTRLINANMIGIPLEVSVTEKENPSAAATLVSKTETKYDDVSHFFPSSVLSYNRESGNASTQVTFNKYDSKGNILQYTGKDGIPTSIIWGYNKTQPIAKIEGAAYDNITNNPLITAIINASDADAANPAAESTLIAALDALRNDVNFKDFQMATFTYDPLIGVTTLTPPSGIMEIYRYDSANRLEKIVDEEGKILKEYKYNYKN